MRVGMGFDIHRLVEGRKLVLGGVDVPFEKGLEGVSDADVVMHAVCDAVLGAAGLGDIGEQFPEDDPRNRDARSSDILARAVGMAREKGLKAVSADVIVYAERPKLGELKEKMGGNLARLLSIRTGNGGVKGKTYEGLGPIGEGLAIAAHAVVVMEEAG